jgi:hypothetical protein
MPASSPISNDPVQNIMPSAPTPPPKFGNIHISKGEKPVAPITPETPGEIHGMTQKTDTVGSPLIHDLTQEPCQEIPHLSAQLAPEENAPPTPVFSAKHFSEAVNQCRAFGVPEEKIQQLLGQIKDPEQLERDAAAQLEKLQAHGVSQEEIQHMASSFITEKLRTMQKMPVRTREDHMLLAQHMTTADRLAKQHGIPTEAFFTKRQVGPATFFKRQDGVSFLSGVTKERLPEFLEHQDLSQFSAPEVAQFKEDVTTGKALVLSEDERPVFESRQAEEWLQVLGELAVLVQKFIDTYKAKQKERQETPQLSQPEGAYHPAAQVATRRVTKTSESSTTASAQTRETTHKVHVLHRIEEMLFEKARMENQRRKKADEEVGEKHKEVERQEITGFEKRQSVSKEERKKKGKEKS